MLKTSLSRGVSSYRQASTSATNTMKALVYKGPTAPSLIALESRPRPTIQSPTDAIVKVHRTTICGTDLHIIKGHVPSCTPGRILGHEGVGEIHEIGDSVKGFQKGDNVLISCITSCGTCPFCRKGMASHCKTGGWILGNKIDGIQAEYVRIPHAEASLHTAPEPPENDKTGKGLAMLSDILPTGLEVGVLNGKVQPGNSVAIIGAGPVGLAALMTAQLYSPTTIVMIDRDQNRLDLAKKLGATHGVMSVDDVQTTAKALTEENAGFDVVIEAVGYPQTFDLCQDLIAPGGIIANVGVHGTKVDLHLERLWEDNISTWNCSKRSGISNIRLSAITTGLVDAVTTPMLLKLYKAGRLDPSSLVTHSKLFINQR